MAVEDIATAPPITIATGRVAPSAQAGDRDDRRREQHLQPADPSTSDFIATMRANENSRPERKDQEHDADLGEHADRLVVVEHAEGVRAEQHADDEVAEDRRQRETPHEREHEQRPRQQYQDLR